MKKKASLIFNAGSTWFSLGINVLIGFFLTPYVIKYLGKGGYGIWTIAGSYIGYYGVLDFGVRSAVTKYVAQYSERGDSIRLSQVVSTGLAVFCITGLAAVLLSIGLGSKLASFFHIMPSEKDDFIKIVWIMGATVGISFPSNMLGAVVTAREHFVIFNCLGSFKSILRATLTVLMLKAGYGLLGVGLAFLAASAFGVAGNILLFRAYAGDISLRWSAVNHRTLQSLIVYGGVATIVVLADNLRMNIDSFIIGRFVDMSAVGIYGVSALIIRYMINLVGASMSVLTPRFSSLDAAGKDTALISLFQQSLFASALLSFGAASIIILFGKRFVHLWLGVSFDQSVTILYILTLAWMLDLAQNPSVWLLYALNKHKHYALLTMAEGLFNFGLSLILVARYGIVGVAMGTFLSMVAVRLLVQPIYISKIANIKITAYLRPFFLPLVTSLLTVLLFGALDFPLGQGTNNLLGLLGSVGCAGAIFLLLLFVGSFAISPGVSVSGKLRYFVLGSRRFEGY